MQPFCWGPLRVRWADRMLQADFLHPDAMLIRLEQTLLLLMHVDIDTLSQLEVKVKDFDLDEYLPPVTMPLYVQLLVANGPPSQFVYSDTRYNSVYIFLHQKIANPIDSGREVLLFNTPNGAEEWIQAHNNHEIEIHQENDHTMIVDETDDKYLQENNHSGKEVSQMAEGLKQYAVDSGDKDHQLLSLEHTDNMQKLNNNTNLEFWDSVSEQDGHKENGNMTNDGFFLDL